MSVSRQLVLIKKLLQKLEDNNYITHLEITNNFSDEPPIFRYRAQVGEDGFISTGGSSFKSRELALLKCLGESIERLSSNFFDKKNLVFGSFEELKQPALNPMLYFNTEAIKKVSFGWAKGENFLTGKEVLIPAQLLYFYKEIGPGEPNLTSRVSTGSAGGSDKDSALLSALYEVIERDAFMTMYLNKISPILIDLKHIDIPEVKIAREKAKRYKLELKVFNIINDLGVPCFISMLVDRAGIGPAIVMGLKASFDQVKALVGSIEEAFYARPWLRAQTVNFEIRTNQSKDIASIIDRALYWLDVSKLEQLDFILNQRPKRIDVQKKKIGVRKQLGMIKKILSLKNYKTFFVEITAPDFVETGYFVMRAIIPGLQPMYFNEKQPEWRMERLRQVSKFFGQDSFEINKIPHPML